MIVSVLMLIGQVVASNGNIGSAIRVPVSTNAVRSVVYTNNAICIGAGMTNDKKNEGSKNDKDNGSDDRLNILLSGFAGALIVSAINGAVAYLRRRREQYSLLQAVSSECDFNLGILDELADGVANGRSGSYKRVKGDFIGELRKTSYRYWFKDDFYRSMAVVSCDCELLNRELEELQEDLSKERRLMLGMTTLHAIQGVRGSTTVLKQKVDSLSGSNYWARVFRWS